MWLSLIVVALAIFAILGGVLAGGVFTIVLVPLAAVALVSAFVFSIVGGAAQRRAGSGGGDPRQRPLPHNPRRDPGHVPTSPERLADARRVEQ
jgi:hypothetical protein